MMSEKLDRFRKYMARYERMVKRYAESYVGKDLAEDVAQEVFLSLYQKIDYIKDATVTNWLLVITKNIAKDYLKKGGSVSTYPMDPDELREYMEDIAEDFFEKREKQKAAAELCGAAFDLLYQKNPQWYEIIVDADVLFMSSKEIAKEIGVSVGYVNLNKYRAKKYLIKMLGSEIEKYF